MYTNFKALPKTLPLGYLKDKTILITGVTSGIGRALSLACSQQGAEVILLGRDQKKCEVLYDEIVAKHYPKPAILPLDLLQVIPEDVDALAATLYNTFGKLDGLVHNAALLNRLCPIEHYPPDLWQKIIHTNLHAPFVLTRGLLPLLKQTQNASIIFSTDTLSQAPKAYWGAYSVSKAGLENFAQILHKELADNTTVRVNCLYPGEVHTRLHKQAYPNSTPTAHKEEAVLLPYLYLLGPLSKERGEILSYTDQDG